MMRYVPEQPDRQTGQATQPEIHRKPGLRLSTAGYRAGSVGPEAMGSGIHPLRSQPKRFRPALHTRRLDEVFAWVILHLPPAFAIAEPKTLDQLLRKRAVPQDAGSP